MHATLAPCTHNRLVRAASARATFRTHYLLLLTRFMQSGDRADVQHTQEDITPGLLNLTILSTMRLIFLQPTAVSWHTLSSASRWLLLPTF